MFEYRVGSGLVATDTLLLFLLDLNDRDFTQNLICVPSDTSLYAHSESDC